MYIKVLKYGMLLSVLMPCTVSIPKVLYMTISLLWLSRGNNHMHQSSYVPLSVNTYRCTVQEYAQNCNCTTGICKVGMRYKKNLNPKKNIYFSITGKTLFQKFKRFRKKSTIFCLSVSVCAVPTTLLFRIQYFIMYEYRYLQTTCTKSIDI